MFEEFKRYLQSKIEISDDEFHAVEKLLTYTNVKHGKILLAPGEISYFGAFVMKGCLRSYVMVDNKEHILQFAPENWWIGDNYAIVRPEPAMLYIDAVEDSKVALFNYDFMENFVNMVPAAASMKTNLELNAFRSLQYRIIHLLSASAEERYSFFINKYPNLATRLPLKMIASYLGIAPQSLSRIRANYSYK